MHKSFVFPSSILNVNHHLLALCVCTCGQAEALCSVNVYLLVHTYILCSSHVCMYICAYIHTYARMYTYVRTYICVIVGNVLASYPV